jgi:hypothetical protein
LLITDFQVEILAGPIHQTNQCPLSPVGFGVLKGCARYLEAALNNGSVSAFKRKPGFAPLFHPLDSA